MATDREEPRLTVSVYLLKAAQTGVAQAALAALAGTVYALEEHVPGGAFLSLPAEAQPPGWLEFVAQLLPAGTNVPLDTQAPGGLLWIPRGSKTFILAFGYGHTKLKDDWLEPEFGKITALALIPQGQVVEVRAEQVFARNHVASERAPRASAVREFGFEADRDLVAAVEGKPASTYLELLGARVRGGTSLRLGVLFSKLIESMDRLAERFDSMDHKTMWPEANNLVMVRDALRISELDAALDAQLAGPSPETVISLAAPMEKSGDTSYPENFALGRLSKNVATTPYLRFANWSSYLRGQHKVPSVQAARDTAVHLLDEENSELRACTIYECIGTEVSHAGSAYVLSSGNWYEANQRFIAETNAAVGTLNAPSHMLVNWDQIEHEGPYNARACSIDSTLWLFDKELVNFGGGQSRFEFCDVMHHPTRTLYFVKHPTASAGVSHLCEQVRRTAENFFAPDPSFRSALSARLTARSWSDITWLSERPKRHEWNLCLVLMGKQTAELPFFAKRGVIRLLNELQRGGFNVQFQSV